MSTTMALVFFVGSVFAGDTPSEKVKVGYVFSAGETTAKLACSWRTNKCALKVQNGGKYYEGKSQYLDTDTKVSEVHLSKDDDRVATIYTDGEGGRPRSLTLWKTDSGKRLDLKIDSLKTEKFDANAFYKSAIDEQ